MGVPVGAVGVDVGDAVGAAVGAVGVDVGAAVGAAVGAVGAGVMISKHTGEYAGLATPGAVLYHIWDLVASLMQPRGSPAQAPELWYFALSHVAAAWQSASVVMETLWLQLFVFSDCTTG